MQILHQQQHPVASDRGLVFPGVTTESNKVAQKKLEENHQFNLFFNDSGFHNHTSHFVLAAYSLGVSPKELQRIYESASDQHRPLPPSQVKIDENNWLKFLGDKKMVTDYRDFFDNEVKKLGIQESILKYFAHPTFAPLIGSGVFHPMIHIGYGVEFDVPLMVSEGLATAALSTDRISCLVPENPPHTTDIEKKSLIEILNAVRGDKRFDGVAKYGQTNRVDALLKKCPKIMAEYIAMWDVQEDEQKLNENLIELYKTCILATGASSPPNKTPKVNFFLMHGLTSVFFVNVLLPSLTLPLRVKLLKYHLASLLTFFITTGRPKFYVDVLKNYKTGIKSQNPNAWFDVIRESLELEGHVIKVIRSLLKAQEILQKRDDLEFEDICIKAAQLTVEAVKREGWEFGGVGFEEAWNE